MSRFSDTVDELAKRIRPNGSVTSGTTPSSDSLAPWKSESKQTNGTREATPTAREDEKPVHSADFVLASALLDEPDERCEDLVGGGLVPAGGTALIVAKPKVGKTTLAYNLALCVARGEPFLGRPTKRGCVLYVALEEKKAKLKSTLRRMGIRHEDSIHFHVGQRPDNAVAWLLENAERYKPALIIIDTLQRFTGFRDVNDYAQVTNATQPLLEIARSTGAAIVWLHHANKTGGMDGDEVLGSTALFGSVDTLITLRRSSERRTLATRQRYGEDLDEIVLDMDPTTGLVQAGGSRREADLNQAEHEILGYLQDRGEPAEATTIRDALEGRNSVISAALRGLVSARKIIRSGGGKKGDPYQYSLPGFATEGHQENAAIAVPAYIREEKNQNLENRLEARQMDLYSLPAVSSGLENTGNSILEGPPHEHFLSPGQRSVTPVIDVTIHERGVGEADAIEPGDSKRVWESVADPDAGRTEYDGDK